MAKANATSPAASKIPRSHSGSDSGSGSSHAIAIVVPDPIYVGDKNRNSTGDSCGYYKLAENQKCRQPRSCYDCLNVKLAGETDGCVLNPIGGCQRIDAYISARDYRANKNETSISMAYINYFPSANSTYCEWNDQACARCNELATSTSPVTSNELLGKWNGSVEAVERFCLGQDGCVCLAACEPTRWASNVQEDCTSENTIVAVQTADSYRSMLPLFMAIQLALILLVIHRQRFQRNNYFQRRTQQQQGAYNNAAAISSPSNRLELTGWREMQAELIQREKAQRGLVSLMSPRNGDADNLHHQPLASPLPPPSPALPVHHSAPQHHNIVLYEEADHGGGGNDNDDDIPELPQGTPPTPIHTRRRRSTDQSVAMLEDGRMSDIIMRRPTATSICEERETRSE